MAAHMSAGQVPQRDEGKCRLRRLLMFQLTLVDVFMLGLFHNYQLVIGWCFFFSL
jgi:hypothetical protein